MTVWEALWGAWVLLFAIVETIAVRNDTPGDTLSEHLRKWFRVDTHTGRTAFVVAFGVFAAWFSVHIVSSLM